MSIRPTYPQTLLFLCFFVIHFNPACRSLLHILNLYFHFIVHLIHYYPGCPFLLYISCNLFFLVNMHLITFSPSWPRVSHVLPACIVFSQFSGDASLTHFPPGTASYPSFMFVACLPWAAPCHDASLRLPPGLHSYARLSTGHNLVCTISLNTHFPLTVCLNTFISLYTQPPPVTTALCPLTGMR